MEQPELCANCGNPIEPGEAWMADEAMGSVAHAGCVYRDERGPESPAAWVPNEASR